jgi:hypothetical protein
LASVTRIFGAIGGAKFDDPVFEYVAMKRDFSTLVEDLDQFPSIVGRELEFLFTEGAFDLRREVVAEGEIIRDADDPDLRFGERSWVEDCWSAHSCS